MSPAIVAARPRRYSAILLESLLSGELNVRAASREVEAAL